MKRILVLHSGGMDSTTCLYKAKAEGAEVFSLGIDYGQRLFVEMLFAKKHCDALGISREIIRLNWHKPEREIPLGRSVKEMSKTVSPAFLPSRNVVLLSLACAHGAGLGVDEVHTGITSLEFSGYPDCTPEFFESFKSMIGLANPGGPKVVAPLLMLNKPQIAQLASEFGIGEFDTWSCYRPQLIDGNIVPCEECDACKLHHHAWHPTDET